MEGMGCVENVQVADVLVAYDHPLELKTYMLRFNQVLLFDNLNCHLLNPNQMRLNDLEVHDCPRFLSKAKGKKVHSILAPEAGLHIPLLCDGVISLFHARKPTEEDKDTYEWIDMTYSSPQYNPQDDSFTRREEALMEETYPGIDFDMFDRSISKVGVSIWQSPRDVLSTIKEDKCFSHADMIRIQSAVRTRKRKGAVTAEQLQRRWNIGLETARKTLQVVTQLGVRHFAGERPMRRMWSRAEALRFRNLNTFMFTDTMQGPCKSRRGNQYLQVYCTDASFTSVYPMKARKQAPETLELLFRDVGVPKILTPDNAPELVAGDFLKKARAAGSHIHSTEPWTPNHQRCESTNHVLKRMYKRAMRKSNAPTRFWDDCYELQAAINSHMAHDKIVLDGHTPRSYLLGDTADISHIAEFAWYDWVWYWNPPKLDEDNYLLGRYLGPSADVGQAMTSKILTDTGAVVHRSSVFPMSDEDLRDDALNAKKEAFNRVIQDRYGIGYNQDPVIVANPEVPEYEPPEYQPYEDETTKEEQAPDADDVDWEAYDRFLLAEVLLPDGGGLVLGTVKARKRDASGNPLGVAHSNPIIDTAVYEVELPDGRVKEYAANIIAEHIFSRIDDEGRRIIVLKEILDHKTDGTAVAQADKYVTNKDGTTFQGRQQLRKTTKGWWLLVSWMDGTESWERLADLKESHPIEVAEYAVSNQLSKEPAFEWWVGLFLKNRDRIIKKVKARIAKNTHKFGIQVPTSVKHALEIDRDTGTDFWKKALAKEMTNVMPAFRFLDAEEPDPVGHQLIRCHMIFDVKMDLTRKARFVAGGHVTETPSSMTYQSVVSRESVRIAFLLAALNDYEICCADIQNAYISAPCREKIWTKCGPEFDSSHQGQRAVIVRALYGLKSAARAFGSYLAETLRDLGWEPCRGEPDVRMRSRTKANGEKIWEYLLVWTDDLLMLGLDPKQGLEEINKFFTLKEGSIGEPTQYLGSTISRYTFDGDPKAYWAMGSSKYVKEAIKNVETHLAASNKFLKTKIAGPLPSGYEPDLDTSPECNEEEHSYYMSQVQVLRWAVELGRIDVATEVSMLASHMASPRKGHLDALFHIWAYLKHHSRSRMVFDSAYKSLQSKDPPPEWKEFYHDAEERIPVDMPEARGKPVQIICFVDASHGSEKKTRRSRTGILIYLNSAPISWLSKRQNTIETSSFGAEFTALRIASEMIVALRFKLRMMGIPIDGPAHVRCDNEAVVKNTSAPESMLNKKHNAVAYHYVRERVAEGTLSVHKEDGKTNLADMLTKSQPGPMRTEMARKLLY
ncbi:hypothetical protein MPSEU_000561000 [Mayamaea pseudoterrestris]|nr:hypothetical protein MPSEU_000561000 [Mayamaea pseudoterrestris]